MTSYPHRAPLEAVDQRCFVKEGFLKNFAKFTEKHFCQSLLLNKVGGLRYLQNTFSYKTPHVAASAPY